MNSILNFFAKKSSIPICLGGAALICILSAALGVGMNARSRHPLEIFPQQPTGVIKVDLAKAAALLEQGYLFVDARSADSYGDGHIPGAYNLDFNDFDARFGGFQKIHDRATPLVVYCEGVSGDHNEDTCETSKLLSERLYQSGYSKVMQFEQGWAFWEKSGKPVARGAEQKSPERGSPISGFNYFRDLSMLVLGMAAILMRKNRYATVACQLVLGIIFVISGSSKILEPYKLSIIIDAYHIMPKGIIPIAALTMPWIEVFAGLCLMSGMIPASGGLLIVGMNLFFIPALVYRAIALSHQLGISPLAVNFDCGCGLGENFAWVLVLRDIGFLCMGLIALANLVRMQPQKPAVR